MKILLFICVVAFVFIFGCSQSPGGQASGATLGEVNVSKVKEFLGPDFEVKEIQGDSVSICESPLEGSGYKVFEAINLKAGGESIKVVTNGIEIACAVKSQKQDSFAGCLSNAECDDGLRSTIDKCNAGKCSNERNTQCESDDSYCPQGCTKKNDSDCFRECLSDIDCDDSDSLTVDSCSAFGLCLHEKLQVGGIDAVACQSDADCSTDNACQTGACSEGICKFENLPSGTVCDLRSHKDCFEGACSLYSENPLRITGSKIEWENGQVKASMTSSKLSLFEVKYGLNVTSMRSMSDEESKGAASHSVYMDGISHGAKYFYEMIAKDLIGLSSVKTETQEFTACIPISCNDSDNCTVDSCNLESGECLNEPDSQNQEC